MDFHAVAEAFVEGQWRVVDATLLAPRQTLVRIATGRDAADTAFLDNHKGAITLDRLVVSALVNGELPRTRSTNWFRSAEVSRKPEHRVIAFSMKSAAPRRVCATATPRAASQAGGNHDSRSRSDTTGVG